MSVTVRFDDCEKLGGPNPLAHNFRVVAQCTSIDFRPAAIRPGFHRPIVGRVARFAMVTWGSRKYIGSSGGNLKFRFGS